ncbi:serine hydrolase [Maricaulis sp.]|uniref:serine hydrolase domain-containing protein n=1 Tax=unclassified Maricaulis TaxID=2632371 RepID=UPI001B030937|nr:serine hydrolase domain-containing protein [Maricaulis sp.]MBO6797068.1 beta-lactamase family protein [Maricaulis sp.]
MKLSTLVALPLSCLALVACGQSTEAPGETGEAVRADSQTSAFAPIVDSWAERTRFSGNVLVVRENEQIFETSFGLANREANIPVDADTSFVVASLTKTFTTVLTLQAVEAGRLELDASLASVLPEFVAPWANTVTVRQMLQNRSGLPHYIDLPGWFEPGGKLPYTREHLLDTLASMPLRFEPGTEYYYSNANFYLLGLILDRVGDQPYEQQLISQLLEPAGLTATGQIYQQDERLRLAGNYMPDEDGGYFQVEIENPAVFRATGSLHATATDLLAWGQAMMRGDFLSQESQAVMLDPDQPMTWILTEVPTLDDSEMIAVRTYNGRIAGHVSMLTLLPQSQEIVIVISNNGVDYGELAGLSVEIAQHLHAGAN